MSARKGLWRAGRLVRERIRLDPAGKRFGPADPYWVLRGRVRACLGQAGRRVCGPVRRRGRRAGDRLAGHQRILGQGFTLTIRERGLEFPSRATCNNSFDDVM